MCVCVCVCVCVCKEGGVRGEGFDKYKKQYIL